MKLMGASDIWGVPSFRVGKDSGTWGQGPGSWLVEDATQYMPQKLTE